MKVLLCALLVVCFLTSMEIGHGCPKYTCCKGLQGSTLAPASFPESSSPARGPSENLDAVVCYFYRPKNCLICRNIKSYKVARCCTASTTETNDTQPDGPTPYNEYLIGTSNTPPLLNIDWYYLYPRTEDASDYYHYSTPTATGRAELRLQPGTYSEGNVTVVTDKGRECWPLIRNVVNSGSMTYNGDTYSGFLYVVMP